MPLTEYQRAFLKDVLIPKGSVVDPETGDPVDWDSLGGAAAGETPSVLGSASGHNAGSSCTVTIPATVNVGDWMFLLASGAWGPHAPAGWAVVTGENGSNINGLIAFRVAQAGDAGSTITVNFDGSGGTELIVAVVSAGSGITGVGPIRAAGGTSITTGLSLQAKAGDLALYMAAARGDSFTLTPSRGSVIFRRASDGDAGSVLASEDYAGGGPLNVTFTSNINTTGLYGVVITISG